MCKYVPVVSHSGSFVCLSTNSNNNSNNNKSKQLKTCCWRFFVVVFIVAQTGPKQNRPENPHQLCPVQASGQVAESTGSTFICQAVGQGLPHRMATCLHWRQTLAISIGARFYILRFSLEPVRMQFHIHIHIHIATATSTSMYMSVSMRPLATFVCHSHSTAADSQMPASVAATASASASVAADSHSASVSASAAECSSLTLQCIQIDVRRPYAYPPLTQAESVVRLPTPFTQLLHSVHTVIKKQVNYLRS